MWMVDPNIMCTAHLLGEHREIHMIVGYLKSGHHLGNYAYHGLVQVSALKFRHEQLVREMEVRSYKHNTPLIFNYEDVTKHLYQSEIQICINPQYSLNLLLGRCSKCRERYLKSIGRLDLQNQWEERIYHQPNVNDVSDMPQRYQVADSLTLLHEIIKS